MNKLKKTVLEDRTEWTLNGLLHREGGPARIYHTGGKSWWKYGKLHNTKGPAGIYPSGKGISLKIWCVKGKYYTEQEFNACFLRIDKLNKILEKEKEKP